MASIYRKIRKETLPVQAEIVSRRSRQVAKWIDMRGIKHTAKVSADGKHVLIESPIWMAKYRDVDGIVRRRSTGCRDEQAARKVLSDWMSDVEKVTAGIITRDESEIGSQAARNITEHVEDYLAFLKAKTVRGRQVSAKHRANVSIQLDRLIVDCEFRRLGDITRATLVRWMNSQADTGMMAGRTINTYRAAIIGFCNWAVKERRLANNPLEGLPKADETTKKRIRRALTQDEIFRLLDAAENRPLRDAMTIRTGQNKGKLLATVGDDERKRLIHLGKMRRAIYATLIYTGLRKGELASLTVGDIHLNHETPYLHLSSKHSKNGQAARIPLRSDLVEILSEYLTDELTKYQKSTFSDSRTVFPENLPADRALFTLPKDFIRVFDRDIAAAEIDKTDGMGRTLDVHCLRHYAEYLIMPSN